MRDIVNTSYSASSTLQMKNKTTNINGNGNGTLSRTDYRSYRDFLESYNEKNSKDDQESVSSTDSGISSYKLSESKSNNTSTSSLNSEINGTTSMKNLPKTVGTNRTGSFRNYMESYSNKKFCSVKPTIAAKQNLIKSEIVIQVNGNNKKNGYHDQIDCASLPKSNGVIIQPHLPSPPLPPPPPSPPSFSPSSNNHHEEMPNFAPPPPPPPPKLPDFNNVVSKKWAAVETEHSSNRPNDTAKLQENVAAANLAKILTQHLLPRKKLCEENEQKKSNNHVAENGGVINGQKPSENSRVKPTFITQKSVTIESNNAPKPLQSSLLKPFQAAQPVQAQKASSTLKASPPKQPESSHKLPQSPPPPKLPASLPPKFPQSPSPKLIQNQPSKLINERKSPNIVDYDTTTVVPITDGSSKVNKTDPNVRKLVYNTYRGLLGAYNNKANDMIATLPRNMVKEDQGITRQLESIAQAAAPPPPPGATGHLPSSRLKSEISDRRAEPPLCVQNAMLTKDKKPFTYTPGGIDLSEIRSPVMARRLERNAMNEGVGPLPQAHPNYPTGPLPPSALAAMQPQLPVQVFPSGRIPQAPHHGGSGGGAPPPPPMSSIPPPPPRAPPKSTSPLPVDALERPDMTKIIPENPMALLRKTSGPVIRRDPIFNKENYTGVKGNDVGNSQPSNHNAAPSTPPYRQVQSPPFANQQSFDNQRDSPSRVAPPYYKKQPPPPLAEPQSPQNVAQRNIQREDQPPESPKLNKAPTPWLQKRQQSQEVPEWAVNDQQAQIPPVIEDRQQQNLQTKQNRPWTQQQQQQQQKEEPMQQPWQQRQQPEVQPWQQRQPQPPQPQTWQQRQPQAPEPQPWQQKQAQQSEPPLWQQKQQQQPPELQPWQQIQPAAAESQPWQQRQPAASEPPAWQQKSPPQAEFQPWQARQQQQEVPSWQQQQQQQQQQQRQPQSRLGQSSPGPQGGGVRKQVNMRENAQDLGPIERTEVVIVNEPPLVFQHPGSGGPSRPQQNNYQQRNDTQGVRVIPVQIEAGASNGHGRAPQSPGGNNGRSYNRQQSWNSNPTQSNTFRVLQKITNTDGDDDDDQPVIEHSPKTPQNFPQQPRRMKQNDNDQELINKFKQEIQFDDDFYENPRYRGGHIPSKLFWMLDDSGLDRDSSLHNEVDPRYRGPNIPSKAFKLLQSMTGGPDEPSTSSTGTVPQNQYNNNNNNNNSGSKVRTIPIQIEGNGSSKTYVPPSQQTVYEPKKYMGSSIPSRSFKMLQAMTGPDDCASPDRAYENNENFTNDSSSSSSYNNSQWGFDPNYPPPSPYYFDPYWNYYQQPYPTDVPSDTDQNKSGRKTPIPQSLWGYYAPQNYVQQPPKASSENYESDTDTTIKKRNPRATPVPTGWSNDNAANSRYTPTPVPFWPYYYHPYLYNNPASKQSNETTQDGATTDEQQNYPQYPYWDPYYYNYYYGAPPPPPPPPSMYPPLYSPYPMYPPPQSDNEEISGYSSTDEMACYGARFASMPFQATNTKPRNVVTPNLQQQLLLEIKDAARKLEESRKKKQEQQQLEEEEEIRPQNEQQFDDDSVTETSDSDTDMIGYEVCRNPVGLQTKRSVSNIKMYDDDESSHCSDEEEVSEAVTEENDDTSSVYVVDETIPHQLSVIFEESERTDSAARYMRESSVATTISEDTNTIENEDEDDEAEESDGTVLVKLPLVVKFTMTESQKVAVLTVGTSEIQPQIAMKEENSSLDSLKANEDNIMDALQEIQVEEDEEAKTVEEDDDDDDDDDNVDWWQELSKEEELPKVPAFVRQTSDVVKQQSLNEPEELSDLGDKPSKMIVMEEDKFWGDASEDERHNEEVKTLAIPEETPSLGEQSYIAFKTFEETAQNQRNVKAEVSASISEIPVQGSYAAEFEYDLESKRPQQQQEEEGETEEVDFWAEIKSVTGKHQDDDVFYMETKDSSLVKGVEDDDTSSACSRNSSSSGSKVSKEQNSIPSEISSKTTSQIPLPSVEEPHKDTFLTVQERIQEVEFKQTHPQEEDYEAEAKVSVKERISAFEDNGNIFLNVQPKNRSMSRKNSAKSFEEYSEEEGDSGVTSDISRHISETETEPDFHEAKKSSKYQRASTHSRLFRLLQDECDAEECVPNDYQDGEAMQTRREHLNLPLKQTSDPESFSSSGFTSPGSPTINDKFINELIQTLLKKKQGKVFKNMTMEKLQATALRILQEDMDGLETLSSSEEGGSFLSPMKPGTAVSTPARTPQEFYSNCNDYSQYYDSWAEAGRIPECGGEILPSKAFRLIQEHVALNKTGAIGGLLARCPRVLSNKNVQKELIKFLESQESRSPSPESPELPKQPPDSNEATSAS